MRASTTSNRPRWAIHLAIRAALLILWVVFFLAGLYPPGLYPQPLTHDQALAKIEEWGPDKTADKIVALDTILQATPLVVLPQRVVLIEGHDLVIGYDPDFITVDVPPYISYRIRMEDSRLPELVPRTPVLPILGGIVAASSIGVLAEAILTNRAPIVREGIAIVAGAGAGALVWIAMRSVAPS